ncbi:hypothetical protein [Vibrio mimicus]|uniref:hypothetical protein n=1 Tax=Vibrio mimicus TaxID=674 RepID=UPI000F503D8E|nr:hypothetical protein [Vibrio mimicus]
MKTDSNYLIIQRKLFTRFALPYEVILDSWCCTLNGESIIDAGVAQSFVESLAFSEDKIVLQLGNIRQRKIAYSFSDLECMIFTSSDAYEQFIERNYDNFDIRSLSCKVFGENNSAKVDSGIYLEVPPTLPSKFELIPIDGLMALIFQKAISDIESVADLRKLFSHKQNFQDLLLSSFETEIFTKADEVEILLKFVDLCFENSLDLGWDPDRILNNLYIKVSEKIREEDKFQFWVKKAKYLLSGSGELTIPLGDDGSVILRSIILTLLNPELDNLLSIKESFGYRIGDKVFGTAKKFALLRAGYSLLNYVERDKLGGLRVFFQDLNAALYNNELSSLLAFEQKATEQPIQTTEVVEESRDAIMLDLAKVSFVRVLEERLGKDKVYSIEGIIPNTGFKSEIIEQNNKELYFWLIDLRGDDKSSKYKGKIGLDLLQVQSSLPNVFRFEVDASGVYLRLPMGIKSESELLDVLKLVYRELALVKAFNVRKSTLIE